MKIIFIGFHEEGKYCIPKLNEIGFSVEAILTLNKKEISKRSGVFDYSNQSKAYNIPLHKIKHINSRTSKKIISKIKPNIICVIGWSQILSEDILNQADLVIGAHASLLPYNRGSAPINWSIINGDKITGNTMIQLNLEVDAGDILSQTRFKITKYDSCKTLYEKVALSNSKMLCDVIKKYSDGLLVKKKQKIKIKKLLPRRRPKDGKINWNKTSNEIYNFIRALTAPYPGAFSFINGEKIIIKEAALKDEKKIINKKKGKVISLNYSFIPELCSVDICCAQGNISIYKILLKNNNILYGKKLIEFFRLKKGFDFEK
tara:strand:- start:1045 stop:1995 length:951 start_codon:yes stop_codon:yes gene_type:complete